MIDESFHLTPLDVRRYDFGKSLRGYDPQRVEQFREQVVTELERLSRQVQDLDAKMRGLQEQLRSFRERDKALNDALVSAQQLRTDIRQQSEREAELIMREARSAAERQLDDARSDLRRVEEALVSMERSRRAFLAQLRVICERQLAEIAAAEAEIAAGRHADRPFVLVAQPSVADDTRAARGKHALWVYAHVPNGSTLDQTDVIERQIERFAPGFRDVVQARSIIRAAEFEQYNANYIGGDIAGGAHAMRQLIARPFLSVHPYRTPNPRLFLCSASTPPGAGVHGMCGFNAARVALHTALK